MENNNYISLRQLKTYTRVMIREKDKTIEQIYKNLESTNLISVES